MKTTSRFLKKARALHAARAASALIAMAGLAACAGSPLPHSGTAELEAPGTWSGSALVRLAEGEILGHADRDGTIAWKGLPYAAPPVGELRWKAPRDPLPWEGVRDAARFGQPALQLVPLFGGVMGSEDCLYLNVWRPASAATGLPVYVFIHGGGNTAGSADFVPDYYGWGVASKSDMVFVSINYRLGQMGWFLMPKQGEEAGAGLAELDASGNYGTLDVIKSLEWIQRNIGAFGGDPGRVTIAGESAGAMNVLSLLLSPRASGLFHRAVVESGAQNSVSRDEALAASRNLAASLLVKTKRAKSGAAALALVDAMPASELESLLRSVDGKTLVGLSKGGTTGMSDWPCIIRDGAVIPEAGYAALRDGSWPNKVPLVIGTNKDELKLFLSFDPKLDWWDPYYQAVGSYGSLSWKATGADEVADAVARSGGAAYVYRFDWGSPDASGLSPMPGNWGRRLGAFHTSEISFFLGTESILGALYTGTLFTARNRPGREALSRDIMSYLAAFAATGNPNPPGGGLPEWPKRPADAAGAAAAGGAVGLVFDAGLTESSIAPLSTVATREGVQAAIEAELPKELAARVRARLGTK